MRSAVVQAKEHFPRLEDVKLVHANVVDYFRTLDDKTFDWIYAHTATVELIHPAFDFASAFSRSVRKGVVMLLDEHGHKYPRFYRWKFARAGLAIRSEKSLGNGIVLLTLTPEVS